MVNDGGDRSVLDGVIARAGVSDRVEVVHHESSRGRWPSANHGLDAATAPLVVLHDDDDAWHPDFLRRGVDYLAAHEDAPGVVGRIEIVWEDQELVEQRREAFQPQLTAPFLADVLLFNRFVPIGFLYRKDIHEVLGQYREDLAVVGDWDFNRKVLTRWPLEYLGDDVLAYWYQRRACSARWATASSPSSPTTCTTTSGSATRACASTCSARATVTCCT